MGFVMKLYDKVLMWSRHPKATRYLGFVSFVDASVFPISPLFMLIPMSYAEPHRAFSFARITTFMSILGGIVGYALGYFASETLVTPFIQWMGYTESYNLAIQWFQVWGFWAILLACFSPVIPYKIFTIGAGVLQFHFGTFLIASIVGRTLRFSIIAALIWWGGPKVEPWLRRMLVKFS